MKISEIYSIIEFHYNSHNLTFPDYENSVYELIIKCSALLNAGMYVQEEDLNHNVTQIKEAFASVLMMYTIVCKQSGYVNLCFDPSFYFSDSWKPELRFASPFKNDVQELLRNVLFLNDKVNDICRTNYLLRVSGLIQQFADEYRINPYQDMLTSLRKNSLYLMMSAKYVI